MYPYGGAGGGSHLNRTSSSSHRSYQSQYPNQVGYGYQGGTPRHADPQLWQWFSAVDTDRSGSISVTELQAALVNEFDLDTVKMLMDIFDTDRSGTIGFQEFTGLWKYINDWQGVFRHFDKDHSGTIDRHELAEAMRGFGYKLPPSLLTLLEQKYASGPSSGYGPPPGITFDRFVRACVAVKTLTEAFQRADHDRDGWVTINYEEFMKIVLNAP
ncbi:EF-hand [Russula brevipes]|nr:EF-hand [Russula brevipes]